MSPPLIARAPGKLVLSGAYAVLVGAPALVVGVDRYATARADLQPTFRSAEVEAALLELEEELGQNALIRHPFVDAQALRQGSGTESRKLGLGSSAAILVASLAVVLADLRGAPAPTEEIWRRALRAHARAQGGGSGVDVDAATYGGVRVFQRPPSLELGSAAAPASAPLAEPRSYPVALPEGLFLEVWSVPEPASTRDFVAKVWALQKRDAQAFQHTLAAQALASFEAERALHEHSTIDLVRALAGQAQVLKKLGDLAGVPIFLPTLVPLGSMLSANSAWLPSGAGGGDIMLYAADQPSPAPFREAARNLGLERLSLRLGAEGVHFL